MTRPYKKYGPGHFKVIKPFVIQGIIDRVTIKKMAAELDIKFATFANMLYRNGIRAITIRHQHSKGEDVFL